MVLPTMAKGKGPLMSQLKKLLVDLGQDAELAARYEKDPEQVMGEYGLTGEEMSAMLDRDLDKLKKLSGLDNLKSNGNVQAHLP